MVVVADQIAASAVVPAKPPSSTATVAQRRDGSTERRGRVREPHQIISSGSPTASGNSQSRRRGVQSRSASKRDSEESAGDDRSVAQARESAPESDTSPAATRE